MRTTTQELRYVSMALSYLNLTQTLIPGHALRSRSSRQEDNANCSPRWNCVRMVGRQSMQVRYLNSLSFNVVLLSTDTSF